MGRQGFAPGRGVDALRPVLPAKNVAAKAQTVKWANLRNSRPHATACPPPRRCAANLSAGSRGHAVARTNGKHLAGAPCKMPTRRGRHAHAVPNEGDSHHTRGTDGGEMGERIADGRKNKKVSRGKNPC